MEITAGDCEEYLRDLEEMADHPEKHPRTPEEEKEIEECLRVYIKEIAELSKELDGIEKRIIARSDRRPG